MAAFLPAPFTKRHWLIALFVLIGDALTYALCANAGMAAGGAMVLAIVLGVLVIIVSTGRSRVFYVGLYTVAFYFVLVLGVIRQLRNESYTYGPTEIRIFLTTFLFMVILPIFVAWIINYFTRPQS
jgi:hypothetical protein